MMSKHIVVDDETYELIKTKVLMEYLENNPNHEGLNISMKFLIRKMVDYYLK